MKISPTAVKSYNGCKRKAFFRSIAKLPREQSPAAAEGTELHAHAEAWLRDGTPPDQTTKMGRLMLEGIPHLPAPNPRLREEGKPQLLIEKELRFTFEGFEFIGFADVIVPPFEAEPLTVMDHKSSSDPKRWGVTAAALPKDEQGIIYGYGGLQLFPEEQDVSLEWVYYGKRDKRCYPVSANLSRQQATDRMGTQIVPVARALNQWRTEFDGKTTIELVEIANQEIPNDPNACGGIGRNCDYVESCQIYPAANLVRRKNTMSPELKAKLEALKNKKEGKSNPPESDKALEETTKEVAGQQPAATDEAVSGNTEDSGSKTGKKKRGRPSKKTTQASVSASASASSDPAAAVRSALGLPESCKVTVTIEL